MKKIFYAFLILSSFILFSCATTVHVDVTRPAELDLNGAASVSILPFKPSSSYGFYEPSRGYKLSILDFFLGFAGLDTEEQKMINFLKSEIEEGLLTSPYLKLVSSDVVESEIRSGRNVSADVYLTGEVISYDMDDKTHKTKRKVVPPKSEDKEPYYVTDITYTRSVELNFRYQVVDASTNEIISFKTVRLSNESASEESLFALPSPFSIMKYTLTDTAKTILREIQPYDITKSISLLSYSSKDYEMKHADDLAKNGLLEQSFELYYEIFKARKIFEAGYNAAVLLEAIGDYDEAKYLLEQISKYADSKQLKKVYKAINDIDNEIYQANKLEKQTQDREGSGYIIGL